MEAALKKSTPKPVVKAAVAPTPKIVAVAAKPVAAPAS